MTLNVKPVRHSCALDGLAQGERKADRRFKAGCGGTSCGRESDEEAATRIRNRQPAAPTTPAKALGPTS